MDCLLTTGSGKVLRRFAAVSPSVRVGKLYVPDLLVVDQEFKLYLVEG